MALTCLDVEELQCRQGGVSCISDASMPHRPRQCRRLIHGAAGSAQPPQQAQPYDC